MSFMFNPYPYVDPEPINHPVLPDAVTARLAAGNGKVAADLAAKLGGRGVLFLDGHLGSDFTGLAAAVTKALKGAKVAEIAVSDYYKSSEELEKMLASSMPNDRKIDPILLFGKSVDREIESLFDASLEAAFEADVKAAAAANDVVIVYGVGSLRRATRKLATVKVFIDATPLTVTLRARTGEAKPLGDAGVRTLAYVFRHFYYYDYEIIMLHRKELIDSGAIDFYIDGNVKSALKMLPLDVLQEVFKVQSSMPFRCTPVYLEGIWGGFYVKKLRSLPDDMRNCAWVFDMIPNEVSIQIKIGGHTMNFPFSTFFKAECERVMGAESVKRFGHYFPIRFNYDDTYGGDGNMSIQVHPPRDYCHENFGEPFQQDESYYVVKTAGSKTYLGFQDDCNVDEFYKCIDIAEREHKLFDHDKYVNSFPSEEGDQYLLPGGTIHSSGRNQVVLEIGSYTIGSYTFKLYDYLRTDLEGVPRPIHSIHGKNVLVTSRRRSAIDGVLRPRPKTVREGEHFKEEIVGENDLIYFSLRRLSFDRSIFDNTNGKFHVLTLVQGDETLIYSKADPTLCYHQKYMDIVVVPAAVGEYGIINLGKTPCKVTKTLLK